MSLVEIHGIAAGGNGVGRMPDGMIVFVPRTAPGDHVEIEIVEKRKNWATGRVVSLVRGGIDRADPECVHYTEDGCGGCQLQHLAVDTQLKIKGQIVGDALRRIARRDVDNPVVQASDKNWRYRRKLTLHHDNDGHIGLHRVDDPVGVFELGDCLITDPDVMALWRDVSSNRNLLPTNFSQIVLSLARDDMRHVVVISEDDWQADGMEAAIGKTDVCFWLKNPKTQPQLKAGPAAKISPLSFDQVNDVVASSIRKYLVEAVAAGEGGVAWDLYGGFGDTARLLVSRGYEVWSVDKDPEAHEWARACGDQPNIHFMTGLTEQVVKKLPPPDVVVTNPPRTGMPPQLCHVLQEWGAKRAGVRLGYISCDPATLARDLSRLPGFEIRDAAAYDLFPQTSHVESAVVLESAVVS